MLESNNSIKKEITLDDLTPFDEFVDKFEIPCMLDEKLFFYHGFMKRISQEILKIRSDCDFGYLKWGQYTFQPYRNLVGTPYFFDHKNPFILVCCKTQEMNGWQVELEHINHLHEATTIQMKIGMSIKNKFQVLKEFDFDILSDENALIVINYILNDLLEANFPKFLNDYMLAQAFKDDVISKLKSFLHSNYKVVDCDDGVQIYPYLGCHFLKYKIHLSFDCNASYDPNENLSLSAKPIEWEYQNLMGYFCKVNLSLVYVESRYNLETKAFDIAYIEDRDTKLIQKGVWATDLNTHIFTQFIHQTIEAWCPNFTNEIRNLLNYLSQIYMDIDFYVDRKKLKGMINQFYDRTPLAIDQERFKNDLIVVYKDHLKRREKY